MITRSSALAALTSHPDRLTNALALEWLLRDYGVCAGAALVLRTLRNAAEYGRDCDLYRVHVVTWAGLILQVHPADHDCEGYVDDEEPVTAQDARWPQALHDPLATPVPFVLDVTT